jgi:hypothetical protein
MVPVKPEAWALLQYDRNLRENRLVGIYLDPALANHDAMLMENQSVSVTVEPFELTTESVFGEAGPITTEFDTPLHVA